MHAGLHSATPSGATAPAIELSTTYTRDSNYDLPAGYTYSRSGHPNALMLERAASDLDHGEAALAFTSGMAAISALFNTIPAGRHVLAPRVMYHGAQDLLIELAASSGFDVELFDDGDHLAALIRPDETDLVWLESPTNPMWDVIDISAAADTAHRCGATLAVDSTVAPPATTLPLDLGADLVFHSATKYYGGHSDVIAGLLISARTDDRWERIAAARTLNGSILAAFDSWLVLRGLRTMFLRFERASANALAIAQHLEANPSVQRVLYPGLASHPGHELATRQMTGGYGGMLSILLADQDSARRVAMHTEVFIPATSLGGVESLIEHRIAVEGPNSVVPPELVRLSVGIEDVGDLIADLDAALLA